MWMTKLFSLGIQIVVHMPWARYLGIYFLWVCKCSKLHVDDLKMGNYVVKKDWTVVLGVSTLPILEHALAPVAPSPTCTYQTRNEAMNYCKDVPCW